MSMPSSSALVETTPRTCAGAQAFFDLATPQRQVAATIAANALGHARHILEVFLQVGREDLGGEPALREHDHLEVAAQELAGDAPRFGDIRAADAQLAIDDRRIDEDEILLAPRRTALLDQAQNGRSASRSASSAGLAIVADEQMNCGFDP